MQPLPLLAVPGSGLSAALDLVSLQIGTTLSVQLSAGATAQDTVDLYESNLPAITSLAQASKVGELGGVGPVAGSRGPTIAYPPQFRYLYAFRKTGPTGGLTLACVGEADSGGGSGVASVAGAAPIVSSGGPNPTISITTATTLAAGSLSAADKNKIDNVLIADGGNSFGHDIQTGTNDNHAFEVGAFTAAVPQAFMKCDPNGGAPIATLDTVAGGTVNVAAGAGAKTANVGNTNAGSSATIVGGLLTQVGGGGVSQTNINAGVTGLFVQTAAGGPVSINAGAGADVHIATLAVAQSAAIGNATGGTTTRIMSPNVAVGPNAPNASAKLDVNGTSGGFLKPRVTTAQRNAINGGVFALALEVYNTTTAQFEYWNGAAWVSTSTNLSAWLAGGNTNAATLVGGTLDNNDVRLVSNGTRRFTILKSGQIAIGAADPAAGRLFDVQGNLGLTDAIYLQSGTQGFVSDSAGPTQISTHAGSGASISVSADGAGTISLTTGSGNINLLGGGVNRINGHTSVNASGVPAAGAALDIQGTNGGLLLPRMTTAQRNALAATPAGIGVFNTDAATPQTNVGTAANPAWGTVAQTGTTTLRNGVSPNIPAHITANSCIQVTVKNLVPGVNANTANFGVPTANRTVGELGTGGQFVINAFTIAGVIQNTDVSDVDWAVFG